MRKISKALIRFSNFFPPQDQGFLAELQHCYQHRFKLEDTRIPAGTKVELSDVWLLEAVKIEDFEALKKGLIGILRAHPKRRFFSASRTSEEIEKSLDEMRASLQGGSWLNIGHIEPNQDATSPTLPLVDRIDFQVYAYFQNLAVLLINITPSKEFGRRFDEIAIAHCEEEHVFTWQRFLHRVWPISRMFRGTVWTGYSLSASQVKSERFDELYSSLKDSTANLVAEFVPGYFNTRKLEHPSFELYMLEEPTAATAGPSPAPSPPSSAVPPAASPAPPAAPPPSPLPMRPIPAFWASLGLDRTGFRCYSEATGSYFLFDPWPSFGTNEQEALPVRIMIDKKKVARSPHSYSLESQISSMVSDWVVGWAPLWALLNLLYTIEARIPDRRDALFKQADRKWLGLWPWPALGFRLGSMSDWFTFERLRGDFRLRDTTIAHMMRGVPQLTYTFFPTSPRPTTEEFTKRLLAELREHIHQTNKVFKMINFASNEVLQVTVVQSNFLLQWVMLLVAVASLAASIVSCNLARHQRSQAILSTGAPQTTAERPPNPVAGESTAKRERSGN